MMEKTDWARMPYTVDGTPYRTGSSSRFEYLLRSMELFRKQVKHSYETWTGPNYKHYLHATTI